MPLPKRRAVWNPVAGRARASGAVSAPAEGQPTRRYVKPILRVGHYIHPRHGWEADITRETLAGFAEAFAKMRANGCDVEVTVDHSPSARDVIGYIVDMWVEGDSLMASHEIRGARNFELVEQVHNTSVEIVDNWIDGKGNEYGTAIVANSVVQAPVMSGQATEPFRRAASLRAARAHAGKLAIPLFEPDLPPENPAMNELLSLIQTITGRTDLNETNAVEALKSWFDAHKAKLESEPGDGGDMSLDPEVAEDRAEALGEKLDGLVTAGKITVATRKLLGEVLLGAAGRRPAALLARGKDGSAPLARRVIDAVGSNDVKLLAATRDDEPRKRTLPKPGSEDAAATRKEIDSFWGIKETANA